MRSFRSALFAAFLGAAVVGCHTNPPVAPTYDLPAGSPIPDADLPLAAAHYVFSRPGTPGRTELARPFADRILVRAAHLFASGRERTGLAAVRFAAMLMRVNKAAPEGLSDGAVAAFEAAVSGPAARGEEGSAIGLYLFWSLARPADARPKTHLDALAKWTGAPADSPPSALVTIGREALRRTEALAYTPHASDRPAADTSLLNWMDQIVAFKDGERTPARYGDEVYSAVLGFRTSGVRLIAAHLRDGDMGGAIEAIGSPQTQGFIPDSMRRALLEAGAQPSVEGYQQVIASLLPATKIETLDDVATDAVLGVALAGAGDHPGNAVLAELTARGMLVAGSGDAAPAILAHALLGTKDDPRRPPAKDIGRALAISSAAIRDYADRDELEAARRTYASTAPLLLAADQIGSVSPSSSMVKTLMGVVEAEAGRPAVAKALYDEAIAADPIAIAWAGRARLEAREGNLAAARQSAAKALAAPGATEEPALHAELLALAGDLARRDGDATTARAHYEKALKLLSPLRAMMKGASAAEVGRRMLMIATHFEGGADKEDEIASQAESASDSRSAGRIAMGRLLRALRGSDPKRGRQVFRRASDLGLSAEDLVRVAIVVRAIDRRAGLAPEPDVLKVLTVAAAKDDTAGRLAKVALGQLDPAAAIAKASTPRRALAVRFAVAIGKWGEGGVAAAKGDLEAIARAEVVGSVESELALEALDPSKGAIAGPIKLSGV